MKHAQAILEYVLVFCFMAALVVVVMGMRIQPRVGSEIGFTPVLENVMVDAQDSLLADPNTY